ncbi:MAG TPA: tRNA (N(6)-L-threonylcarbamoyladenosine(37)-C(2))-methylthiotransferase MtaB [Spirochaetia bacterium]|nr:tRNA (N(6)-L-threonylcarbamoyladenosine(37)-C(2))-methylthiotransferase MtaB [Spirochaetia bacterium]
MNVKIYSLGCRLNQYEIESVSTEIKNLGHQIVDDDIQADLFIVNSCVVTSKSEAKTRNLISRSTKNKTAKTIVTGCFAKAVEKKKDVLYLSNDFKYLIPKAIENWDNLDFLFEEEPSRLKYTPPVDSSTTRVNLKIQDGCDHFCSYCIIPLVRGRPVSKPLEDCLSEFEALLKAGYKEIVLSGITIGKYLSEGENLGGLIEKLLLIKGDFRIHVSSIDPDLVDEDFISLFSNPKMVAHLHLSLQSGSNPVLKNMNRRYTKEDFLALVSQIRTINPFFNLTTDLIIGFPGETDQDFQESLEIIEKAGFSHVHSFRYSPRPLTKAYSMKGNIPEAVKKKRSLAVIEKAMAEKNKFYRKFEGREEVLLCEKTTDTYSFGHTSSYLPVTIAKPLVVNQFYKIICRWNEEKKQLTGELVH